MGEKGYLVYQGNDGRVSCRVGFVGAGAGDAYTLKPRLDLINHGQVDYELGPEGPGPMKLALGILADCLGDDRRAVRLHYHFKDTFLCAKSETLTLFETSVRQWADSAEKRLTSRLTVVHTR